MIILFCILAVLGIVFLVPKTRNYVLVKLGFTTNLHILVDSLEKKFENIFLEVKTVAEVEEKKIEASKIIARLETLIAKLKKFIGSV